jgi:hypothetical protein
MTVTHKIARVSLFSHKAYSAIYLTVVIIVTSIIMPLVQVDKKQLEQLKKDLKSRQTMYMAEAKARMAYANALAEILQEVSSRCKDKTLVNDIVTVALRCERQAKKEGAVMKK